MTSNHNRFSRPAFKASLCFFTLATVSGIAGLVNAATPSFPSSLSSLKLTPVEIVIKTRAQELNPANGRLSVDETSKRPEFSRLLSEHAKTSSAITEIEKLLKNTNADSPEAAKMKEALDGLKAQMTYFNSFETQVYAKGERNPLVFSAKESLVESYSDYLFLSRRDRVEGRIDRPVGYQFHEPKANEYGFVSSFTVNSSDHILMIRDGKYRMGYENGEAIALVIKQNEKNKMNLNVRIQRPNLELGYINLDVIAQCAPSKVYNVVLPDTFLETKVGLPEVFITCKLQNDQGYLKFKVDGVDVSSK